MRNHTKAQDTMLSFTFAKTADTLRLTPNSPTFTVAWAVNRPIAKIAADYWQLIVS